MWSLLCSHYVSYASVQYFSGDDVMKISHPPNHGFVLVITWGMCMTWPVLFLLNIPSAAKAYDSKTQML